MPERLQNIFAGSKADRRGERRRDRGWVDEKLADPRTRFVPVWRENNLLTTGDNPRAVFLKLEDIGEWSMDATPPILLGRFQGVHYFAVGLDADREPLKQCGAFLNLHRCGSLLPFDEANLLAYARGMVLWNERCHYCNCCGSPTVSANAGHIRQCTNADCQAEQFPRIDPAIIVLVADGDRCLLGRQPGWPEGVYSTIAGFVEPGESLEDAVEREVYEEAGVGVIDIRYHSSQPWPFPSSLMLGFTAVATSNEITIGEDELEDVRWFTREQIASGDLRVPSRVSIAYRLVEDWFDDGEHGRLADLQR